MPVKVPANKNGFAFGAYVLSNGMPGRVCGASNPRVTFTEVWGYGHDIGDVYTSDTREVTKEQFDEAAKAFGHNDTTSGIEKLRKWDAEQAQVK